MWMVRFLTFVHKDLFPDVMMKFRHTLMYTSLTGQVPPNSEGFDSVFKLTSKAAQEMFSSGCAILPRLTEYKLAQASSEVVTRSR